MPQWAGSCWYYLRYIDPNDDEGFWDADRRGAALDAGRPVRRRRRARGAAPALRPLLAQGALRPWLRRHAEPFRTYFSQGYIQAPAFTDARGQVEAWEVEEVVGDDGHPAFHTGEPVSREFGKITSR